MVSLAEAQSQLEAQKKKLAEQRKQIEQTKLKQLTRAQLMKQTLGSIAKRKTRQTQLKRAKQQELVKLRKVEKQVSDYERKIAPIIKKAKIQQAAISHIQRLAAGRGGRSLSRTVRQLVNKILNENPDIRHAVNVGQGARIAAKEGGFSSVKEMMGFSKLFSKSSVSTPKIDVPKIDVKQLPGTYDPLSGVYISPEGYGMTMLPGYVPPLETKIVFGGLPTGQVIIPGVIPTTPFQKLDISVPQFDVSKFDASQLEAYKKQGFTQSQAEILTREGAKQMVSFTPKGAEEVLRKEAQLQKLISPELPSYIPPELRKVLKPEIIQRINQLPSETQRYKDFGYTQSQAEKLARESLKMGGVTFGPEAAKKIIRTTIPEKVSGALEDVGTHIEKFVQRVPEKVVEIIEKVPPILDVDVSPIREAIKWEFEVIGRQWAAIYAVTLAKLPPEWQPSKIIPGKEEEYKRLVEDIQGGKIKSKDVNFEGLVIPITPKEVGKGVETVAELGMYVTPSVAIPYAGLEFLGGVQEVKYPEKEAQKIVEEQIKQYNIDYKEQERILPEGYELETKKTIAELEAELLPLAIEQVKTRGAVTAATSLAFLTVAGGVKAYQWAKTPVTKVIPTRALRDRFGITEHKALFVEGKKPVPLQKYTIWGEKRPPIDVIKTTRIKELLKLKPTDIKHLKAIKFKQYSYNPLTGKEWVSTKGPSWAVQIETGKKYGTVFLVEGGKSIPRDLASFMKLSKTEKYAWRKLAEKIAGRPVHDKMVVNILKKESLKFKGDVVAKKLFRFKDVGKDKVLVTAPWKEGKLTTQAETVTEFIPTIQKDVTQIFKFKVAVKDVTKPFARATGKVDYISGLTIQHKPIYLKTDKGIGFISKADIKKTPFKDTFTIQKVKTAPEFKVLPRPKPSPLPPPKVVTPVQDLPYMVGGAGLKEIPYEGMGTYEVSEVTGISVPGVTKQVLVVPDKTPELEFVPSVTKVESRVIQVLKPKVEQALVPRLISVSYLKSLEVPKQVPRQVSRQIPWQVSRQIPRQILRQIPKQIPFQIPRQIPKPVHRPKRIPTILIPLIETKPPKKRVLPRLRAKVPKQGHTFEIRRKGKWERAKVPFAFATKEGAEAIAQERVLKEAAASYRIVKAKRGRKVVRTRRKISPYKKVLFRKGKKGIMVQKKLLRILTPGEKKEISYAGGLARMKKAKLQFGSKSTLKLTPKKKSKSKKRKGGKKYGKKS